MDEKTQEMFDKVVVGIQAFEHRGYRIPNHMAGGIARYFVYGLITGDFLKAVMRNDFMAAYELADDLNYSNMGAYPAYLFNVAPTGSYGSKENVHAWIAKGGFVGKPTNNYYTVFVFSSMAGPPYKTITEAETAIKLLDPAHQLIAEIVPTNEHGERLA